MSQHLVKAVRGALSEDLLKPEYLQREDRHPMGGHCYAASEALYHMLGGKENGFVPMNVQHEGDSHWWIRNIENGEDLDPTGDQFQTPVPYHMGRGRGFLTRSPSARAQEIINRVRDRASTGEEPSKFVTHPYEVNKKTGAFSPSDWQRVVNSQREPADWRGVMSRYLYHGSPMNAIHSIHENGLLPFDHPSNPTKTRYEGEWTTPRHNRVYLGDPPTVSNFQTPWHRIDLSKLDPNNFGVDEDHFLTPHDPEIPPAPDEYRWKEHGVHLGAWADANVDKLDAPHHTLKSLLKGSVSHFGPIPPEAISFNPYVNFRVEYDRLKDQIERGNEFIQYGEEKGYSDDNLANERKNLKSHTDELDHFEKDIIPRRYAQILDWANERGMLDSLRGSPISIDAMVDTIDEIHHKMVEEEMAADKSERMKTTGFELDRYAKMIHRAAWPDVMAKAKRMIQDGRVTLHRNGYNNIVATVIGDHGVYQPEISRADPNSRAITTWTCECDWDQYAWGRTREWKKYEGRPCSHVLATYWKALSTPLDEDAQGQPATPGQKPAVDPMAQQQQLFDPGAPTAPAPPPGEPAITYTDPNAQPPVPATMQDLTIPQSPGAMVKPIGPLPDPYVNKPMFMPRDPQKERLFNLPGALSKRYAYIAEIDNIPVVVVSNREEDDFQKILELSNAGKIPIVQAIQPIYGEYSGGKIAVPGAQPYDHHDDYPLHRWWDLGWDPATGRQANPPASGPEEKGRFGEIPAGARLEVWAVDEGQRWILVAWSTPFGKLQHHLIKAWADPSDVRLIPNQQTPFIQRPHL